VVPHARADSRWLVLHLWLDPRHGPARHRPGRHRLRPQWSGPPDSSRDGGCLRRARGGCGAPLRVGRPHRAARSGAARGRCVRLLAARGELDGHHPPRRSTRRGALRIPAAADRRAPGLWGTSRRPSRRYGLCLELCCGNPRLPGGRFRAPASALRTDDLGRGDLPAGRFLCCRARVRMVSADSDDAKLGCGGVRDARRDPGAGGRSHRILAPLADRSRSSGADRGSQSQPAAHARCPPTDRLGSGWEGERRRLACQQRLWIRSQRKD